MVTKTAMADSLLLLPLLLLPLLLLLLPCHCALAATSESVVSLSRPLPPGLVQPKPTRASPTKQPLGYPGWCSQSTPAGTAKAYPKYSNSSNIVIASVFIYIFIEKSKKQTEKKNTL